MAPKADHTHRFGNWRLEPKNKMWHRYCLVGGCQWQNVTSVDPNGPQDGMDRAMSAIAGHEPDDGMGELLEAVGDVVSDLEGHKLEGITPAEQRLYNAYYVVCPPDLSTT